MTSPEDTIPYMKLPEDDPDATQPNIAERLSLQDPELEAIADQVRAKELEMKRLIIKMGLEEHIRGKRYRLGDGSVVTIKRIRAPILQEAVLQVEDAEKNIIEIRESEFQGQLLDEAA